MTLPEVCPLDESQACKGRECHLFCLEWRTREPTCLIGYNITSKARSSKSDRKKDTYAEDTFRKLGQQHQPRWKNVTEKGDWTPTRPAERIPEKPAGRREENPYPAVEKNSQKLFFGRREEPGGKRAEKSSEESLEERIQKREATSEAEKASMRLEARLKKEHAGEEPVRHTVKKPEAEEKPNIQEKPKVQEKQKAEERQKVQEKQKTEEKPKVQEKPKIQEKIISRDKHATIFAACNVEEETKNIYPAGKEEKPEKPAENRDKRKKFNEVMDIDLPDNHEDEFWS